jgi:sugar phosphate isomerase/epimerase
VRVAFEPLNAAIMNVESAIWTLEQGLRLVEQVDRPSFGLCVDLWNIWQNAAVEEAIRACGDRIFVVQVSDWRTPRSFQDRLIVGQGAILLPPLLRAVHESGYRGPYVVEIFSGDVPD